MCGFFSVYCQIDLDIYPIIKYQHMLVMTEMTAAKACSRWIDCGNNGAARSCVINNTF